jgi:hypothetical protein
MTTQPPPGAPATPPQPTGPPPAGTHTVSTSGTATVIKLGAPPAPGIAPPTVPPAAPPKLTLVPEEERSPHLNVILYGPPKVGKSTAAASAPGPILLINTDGSSAYGFARKKYGKGRILEVEMKGKGTLDSALKMLREGEKIGDQIPKTVVLDNVGEVYRILLEEMNSGRPTLGQYGDAGTIIERWARHVRNLPYHLVLVAHEQLLDSSEGNVLMPQCGGRKLSPVLCAMVDVIAYCQMQPGTQTQGAVFWAQTTSGYGRYAGNREGFLGQSAFTNLDVWVEAWNNAAPQKPANEEQK